MNRRLVLRNELQLEVETNKLGKGFFGRVYNARRISNPDEQVACKLFESFNSELWKSFVCEVKAYRVIQSAGDQLPHIVHFEDGFHVIEEKDANDCTKETRFIKNSGTLSKSQPPKDLVMYGLVVEKVDMNVEQWMRMKNMSGFTEQEAFDLCRQVGSTLHYLHSKYHLCHNDLKLNNIGVMTNQPNGSIPTLKLYDFGMAKTYDQKAFDAAEVRSSKFSLLHDHNDLQIVQVQCETNCPFMYESYLLGRIVVNNTKRSGFFSKPMDKVKNQVFKKVVFGMATESLSISSAMTKFDLFKSI